MRTWLDHKFEYVYNVISVDKKQPNEERIIKKLTTTTLQLFRNANYLTRDDNFLRLTSSFYPHFRFFFWGNFKPENLHICTGNLRPRDLNLSSLFYDVVIGWTNAMPKNDKIFYFRMERSFRFLMMLWDNHNRPIFPQPTKLHIHIPFSRKA